MNVNLHSLEFDVYNYNHHIEKIGDRYCMTVSKMGSDKIFLSITADDLIVIKNILKAMQIDID